MNIKFSKNIEELTGTATREFLKLAYEPDIITLSGGLPSSDSFPLEEIKHISKLVLDEFGTKALQYTITEGYEPLRHQIAERMNRKNKTNVSKDEILLTCGSQQGLDFSGRVFIDSGDVIICESPTYTGAINAFDVYNPTFVEIPTDENGMIMEELERVLETTDNVKMIYVIPDFQNPTGVRWSIERRIKFMEIINKYEIPVIEDNPYSELNFTGEVYPSLKSMDEKGLVIFLGTFSKILCPGYRIGWVCAPEEILKKYIYVKQRADLQSSTIAPIEISKFIELYDLDAHIESVNELYKKRKDIMIKTMKEEFPPEVKYTNPDGGLFLWIELPENLKATELIKDCLKEKVAYMSGDSFFPNGGKLNYIRLNFSSNPEDKIIEGIKKIGKVLREHIK